MRLRELIVAIKIKVDTKAAEKVEKVLGEITKHAKSAATALDKTAKSAGKLDRELGQTAKSGKKASKGLDSFTKSAKKAEAAADQAGKAADRAGDKIARAGKKAATGGKSIFGRVKGADFKGAAGNVASGIGTALAAGGVAGGLALGVAAERESLRATLKNLEGDESKAQATFARIEAFAAKTPFQIEEVTSGLIKLRGAGLDASDDALRSYGDLASTVGKTLDDVVEAAKDAVRGENERLKELNIGAKTMGDQVEFTFQGQTTIVNKTDEAIQEYLISLGKLPGVAGAMAGQMETLRGKWSNFKDAVFSAVDAAMVSSGALEEAKGLLGDLTGTAEDGASVFGELLASALKDVRTWLKSLTREQIRAWLERAAEAGKDMITMLIGLVDGTLQIITVITDLIEGLEGGEQAIQTIVIALGALMLAGGGIPGLFAAIGAAAIKMGMDAAEADMQYKSLFDNIGRFQNMFNMKKLMAEEGPMSIDPDRPVGEDTAASEAFVTDAQKANRSGLGEEFFIDAEKQLVQLGIEEAVAPGDLTGQTKRLASRRGKSAEQILAERGGFDARIGVNKEAAKLLDAVEAKKKTALDATARNARKQGLDDEAIETLVNARQAELDARTKKAAAKFTKQLRGGKVDIDDAIEESLKELDDKEKKKKKGRKGKKGKDKDILQALGLKGPGSILENRPAPQSLLIQTTILVKAADSISVPITMPAGSTMADVGEAAGAEVGKALDKNLRDKLLVVIDDAWSLRWDALAKARGGGRVPKSSKRRGGA